MRAQITGGTGVWSIQTAFSEDVAGIQSVYTTTSIVGAGLQRVGWQPIVAQYMNITATLTVPSAGDTISIIVVPSLLDAPQAVRIVTTPYFQQYEGIVGHGLANFYTAGYIMPGPATLTVRGNQYSILYDLQALDNTNTWQNLVRYQVPTLNLAYQYDLQVPDAPVRLKVSNSEAHSDITFDVTLAPA